MTGMSRVFVGSLTRETGYFKHAHGEGISVLDFDETTGGLSLRHRIGGIDNPTFLALGRDGRHFYATSEVFGWNEGTITAYRIAQDGSLGYINKQATLGSIAAHCSLDQTGRFAFAANYAHEPWNGYGPDVPGQAVAVFPLGTDGRLGAAISHVAHQGTGPVPFRQTWPHPHCVVASPDNRFVIVTDLGTDRLHSYRFDDGRLSSQDAPLPLALGPGAGPRHFIFAPEGDHAYVINELNGTVAHLAYDAPSGGFEVRQVVSTLPTAFTGLNNCADLHLSPDGRFLYGSNRGHNSIAIFAVDPHSGDLSPAGHVPTGGDWPRSFALSVTGRFLLVANQDSDSLTIFLRDEQIGGLEQIGAFAIGTPMAISVHPI